MLYRDDISVMPTSWSPDGKAILFRRGDGSDGASIFMLPLVGDRKPALLAGGAALASTAAISPDGRWVAYGSLESGRPELYVTPYPGPGGKLQISANGGTRPRWRADGKEIFYQELDARLVAAEVRPKGGSLEIGRAQPLFSGLNPSNSPLPFDVTPAGDKVLATVITERAAEAPLTLVQNWTAELKK